MMKTKQKGQFTIIGLMMIVITLIVLGALMPTITSSIETAKLCVTGTASVMLDLIPLIIVIAVVMGIVLYASAPREPRYG